MDKNELERRLEAAEKQMIGLQYEIQNLKAKLADVQDEQEIPDFPVFKTGGDFWFVNSFFFFHTEEYAQEFADRCKLIAMMLHCKWHTCRDYKENFEDDECKWYVYYANNTSRFAADYCVNDDHSSVYFDTEENAQQCADWLNNHWKEDGND